ncbi:hypothetical protein [Lacticaseibacillus songhuajiangensis]|uniref:hypothetical protein n=1 Tax=Lacticaseibacillus songhuajiangensis TaxID=1296539 RepID=UPI000F7A98F6|nr:hypothetical protein [Lacticaseibacillus songhuajiangensis]
MQAGTYISAAGSEKLANKVQNTWHDAIFNDAGATVVGKQYTDFSTAIVKLIASETTLTKDISTGNDVMDEALASVRADVTDNASDKLKKAEKLVK